MYSSWRIPSIAVTKVPSEIEKVAVIAIILGFVAVIKILFEPCRRINAICPIDLMARMSMFFMFDRRVRSGGATKGNYGFIVIASLNSSCNKMIASCSQHICCMKISSMGQRPIKRLLIRSVSAFNLIRKFYNTLSYRHTGS